MLDAEITWDLLRTTLIDYPNDKCIENHWDELVLTLPLPFLLFLPCSDWLRADRLGADCVLKTGQHARSI